MQTPRYTINAYQKNQHQTGLDALQAIESGQVIFLPNHAFAVDHEAKAYLCESILHPKHKNISYHIKHNQLAGLSPEHATKHEAMRHWMLCYAHFAKALVDDLCPHYREQIIWGRTSYRPAQIKHRRTSPRQDDTRLHVDAFPSSPVQGQRILRVFCNINPDKIPRTWNVGEPFATVLSRFANRIPKYRPLLAKGLHLIRATKTLRTAYDHHMLHLHDGMKLDAAYQATCPKNTIDFPAQSTWMVFTDHVSHAALSGQYLLEQTFYLPVNAMYNPQLSPLYQWEQHSQCALV